MIYYLYPILSTKIMNFQLLYRFLFVQTLPERRYAFTVDDTIKNGQHGYLACIDDVVYCPGRVRCVT